MWGCPSGAAGSCEETSRYLLAYINLANNKPEWNKCMVVGVAYFLEISERPDCRILHLVPYGKTLSRRKSEALGR